MPTIENSKKRPISIEVMKERFPDGVYCHECSSGIVLVSSVENRHNRVWTDFRSIVGDSSDMEDGMRAEELKDRLAIKIVGWGPVLRLY